MYYVHNVEFLQKAAEKMYKHGKLKNSNKEGEYNIYGAMGELYIYELFKPWYWVQGGFPESDSGIYDYDLIINKMKVEIKTSAIPNMPPGENWDAKIFETSMHQNPDLYFFVCVKKDLSEASFIGYCTRDFFRENATKHLKGDPMETSGAKQHYFLNDSRIIPHSKLKPFKDERLKTLYNTYRNKERSKYVV